MIRFDKRSPHGLSLEADLAAVVANIEAIDPDADGAAKALSVYEARKRALENEIVQHALATRRLSAASVIQNCSLA